MTARVTQMFREAGAAPTLVRAQLERNEPQVRSLAKRLRRSPSRAP